MSLIDVASTTVLPEPPPALRLRLGDWGFVYNQRSGKFETYRADRKDLAHLIIAWGTKSGELDIHLTRGHEQAMAGDGEKDYEPLVRISPVELEQIGSRISRIIEEGIVPRLMEAYRKYTPGWLGHRGYAIIFVEGDELFAWLRRAAPRSRGKYRVKPEQIVDSANYPPSLADSLYYPSVLYELRELAGDVPVSAVRIDRRRRGARDTITLRHTLGPDGTVGWWGTKHSALGAAFRRSTAVLAEVVVSLLGAEHANKIERILLGLGVEVEERAHILRTVASILSEHDVLPPPIVTAV